MIFDTDIFIWVQRGDPKAAKLIDDSDERYLSVQSYMELLQCANDKEAHKNVKSFLREFDFEILPLSQNIGHRAAIYIEEYSLSNGIRAGDAIIAASAVEKGLKLCTSNQKHFKCVRELSLKVFRPSP